MPKAGFASKDMRNDADAWTGNLVAVEPHIGRYLSENADSTSDVSAFESNRALHIRVGPDQFILTLQSPNATESHATLYSFNELKELEITPPAAVVEGFLHEGETVLIAGRGKVGKSRLTQQMSLGIEAGTEFFGMSIPKRRRVLTIDLENRLGTVRERLLRMAGAQASVQGLFVWCAKSISDNTVECSESGIKRLSELIKLTGAEVLIIDPWRLFFGKDENNAEEVVRGLKMLSVLKNDHPFLTTIIVHHVRKERLENPRKLMADPRLWMDSVSGHHALLSHVDACFGLERERGDDEEEWIVFGGVARNTEPRTILLEEDEDTLRFTIRRNEEALDLLLTKAEREIWRAATGSGHFTYTKLLRDAKTTNKKAVASVLKKATAQGLLVHDGTSYRVRTD